MNCDVLVVGAGPAGSSAARAAAKSGVKTIFIDKKEEIGVPVQCAEALGRYLFPFLPFKIPKEQIIWSTEGIAFWAEDIKIVRRGLFWAGYAINRKDFDKWLAYLAIKAGAKLQIGTELIDLEINNEYNVKKAFVRTARGDVTIKPRVVIAADGVESTILKLLNFEINKKGNIGEVLGFEMWNLNLKNPNYEQLFIGDFAPGGYAYIFPKSKHVANVGVATLFPEKSLEEYYEEFLEIPEVKKQLKEGFIAEEKSGKVPVRNLVDEWVYGNILLAGDNANQNIKPFVEGIIPSIICGDIAGKIAAAAVKNNSNNILDTYPKMVRIKFGKIFEQSYLLERIAYELAKFKNKSGDLLRLALSANILPLEKIEQLKFEDYDVIKKEVERWQNSLFRRFSTSTKEQFNLIRQLFYNFYHKIMR
ncbi:MAG: NAD(P)/FAD-dependent oxidoreductase [Candidatus Methanospirareceae archaeon]